MKDRGKVFHRGAGGGEVGRLSRFACGARILLLAVLFISVGGTARAAEKFTMAFEAEPANEPDYKFLGN